MGTDVKLQAEDGSWLCPAPFDRTRLLDMEARLTKPRALMYGSLAIAFLLCAPLIGWWILAPLAFTIASYQVLQPRIATSDRPEFVVAATVVIAQVMIGLGIALTGGPTSPVIALLLLPIITLPARFGTRGVQAGVAVTVVVLLASTLIADAATAINSPEHLLIAIAALVGLAAFSDGLMRAEVESRSHSAEDPLTGLLNRKALTTHFAEVARQAEMTGRDVCLVVFDLDHFKAVNDEHGHARGDAVLREAADLMRSHLRSFELVYRLGGEEFLVLMPGVNRVGGRIVADRLRVAFEETRLGELHITASFGVAMATGAAVQFDPLFEAADQAMYRAKAEGRNSVVLAPELRPEPPPVAVDDALPASAAVARAT